MLLPTQDALHFIEGYKSVLMRVLQGAGVPQTSDIVTDLVAGRRLVRENLSLLGQAIEALALDGEPVAPDVVAAVRTLKLDRWVYLRHTQRYAVLIDSAVENAYQVRALTTPLYDLWEEPPVVFEAGLVKYQGLFVCDGLIEGPMMLGRGYKAQFNAAYSRMRSAGKVHAKPDQP